MSSIFFSILADFATEYGIQELYSRVGYLSRTTANTLRIKLVLEWKHLQNEALIAVMNHLQS